MTTLSPYQFPGEVQPRDLTASRLSTRKGGIQERASVYRDARDAYAGRMEESAIGYGTEEREFRQTNPPPTWKSFLREGTR